MRLGLTGGIASGKSTVANIFKKHNIIVIDSDKISRDIAKTDKVSEKLINTFGPDILTNEKVDRKKLRHIVFSNKSKLIALNEIMHPPIIAELEKFSDLYRKKDLVIFDIPLLHEARLAYLCDKVLLVFCDKEIQINRVIERDKVTRNEAIKIIENQMDIQEKKNRSNFLIENNGTFEELEKKIELIIKNYKK